MQAVVGVIRVHFLSSRGHEFREEVDVGQATSVCDVLDQGIEGRNILVVVRVLNKKLLENQGGESVFIKQFLSHGLNLGGGNLIHLLVEAVNVLLPAIVQEALAEVEGEVLAVVARYAYLTLNLFLGSLELRIAQWLLHELIQLLANQTEAALHIVLIAAEIDAPGARVAISHHRAFYGVNQSVVLSEGKIQLGVHTRSAQHIVEQIERHSAVVVHIVSPGSNHHMSLMRILLHHDCLASNFTLNIEL